MKKRREKRKLAGSKKAKGSNSSLNPLHSILLESDVVYSKSRSSYLGGGSYGEVYRGFLFSAPVAVKVVNLPSLIERDYGHKSEEFQRKKLQELTDDLQQEITILVTHQHPHIVTTMGVVPETAARETLIVMDLQDGDLEHLLIQRDHDRNPGHATDIASKMKLFDKLQLIKQAALGMEFLHSVEPAIIHKDLKLENLMYKNAGFKKYHISIADFGLSSIKPKSSGAVPSDNKGNLLTQAPEIMRKEDFDHKCDVYSFSMVMWGIFICQDLELYANVRTIEEWKQKVIGGFRPPLPQKTPKPLVDLFTAMWQDRPEDRPEFSEINNRLEAILVNCAISDRSGRSFWLSNFPSDHIVAWEEFLEALSDMIGELSSIDILCLEALLAEDITGEGSLSVNIQNFGNMLTWFGGLKFETLQNIKEVLEQDWFHGKASRQVAESRLKSQPPGSYLVRFRDEPGSFAIARRTASGHYDHHIVWAQKNGGYTLNSPLPPKNPELLHETLVDIINSQKSHLQLNVPCPGNPFSSIFEEKPDDASQFYTFVGGI
eukprot:CAMPEP_0174269790 /NCGR_PEP_ID=MMETSP0439-20130205/42287_1 /TAXON_ID=0 /ORGANISM="Stereomyxa ramosa, Strain Chinc5" /LENGTH=544 /DNA_ID=CAMNT_0015358739 /DNA_START=158 /DNA_END=1792 /DNA_ORIENTATION=-